MELTSLPGHELVLKGRRRRCSSRSARRGRQAGIEVPEPIASPEHRLYDRLAAEDSDAAHSRYNALVRRLVSFERAADVRFREAVERASVS